MTHSTKFASLLCTVVALMLGSHTLATPTANAAAISSASAARDPGYRYFFTTPAGTPVGYDHCRAHPVLINPANSTPAMVAAVQWALPRISAQTGYQFYFAGFTTLPWNGPLAPGESNTTAAIRVGFATARQVPQLGGTTAGFTRVNRYGRGRTAELGRGRIVLDAGDYRKYTKRHALTYAAKGHRPVNYARWFKQSLIPHEFGHVLGLAHTSVRSQLMAAHVKAIGFQRGDKAGLARLLQQPCA